MDYSCTRGLKTPQQHHPSRPCVKTSTKIVLLKYASCVRLRDDGVAKWAARAASRKTFAPYSLETDDIFTDGLRGVCWGISEAVSCQSMSSSSSTGPSDPSHTFSLGVGWEYLFKTVISSLQLTIITHITFPAVAFSTLLHARANQRGSC